MTQDEYDYLMLQEKTFEDKFTIIQISPAPIKWTKEIKCKTTSNKYLLDFYRGSFELSKFTANKRFRQTLIMLRYDNGGRHTNPDGETFEGPHVHLFKEGFNDKFAYPISIINIEETDTMEVRFKKILHFCNIKDCPDLEVPMF